MKYFKLTEKKKAAEKYFKFIQKLQTGDQELLKLQRII